MPSNPPMRRIASNISGEDVRNAKLRQCVVKVVGDFALDIELGGALFKGVKYLSSYAPEAGDSAWALVNGSDLLVIGVLGPIEGWQEVTDLRNGATAYQTGITNQWTPRYRKIGGVVYLQGLINTNVTTTPLHVATLPIGYRPRSTYMGIQMTASTQFRRMDIDANGSIIFREAPSYTTSWHSITASFPADN